MADFLSNLLDRSLYRVPILQRRQPSLFEPGPPSQYGPGSKYLFAAEAEMGFGKDQEDVVKIGTDSELPTEPGRPDVAASGFPSLLRPLNITESPRVIEPPIAAIPTDHPVVKSKEMPLFPIISSQSAREPKGEKGEQDILYRSVETIREKVILEKAKPPSQTLHVEHEDTIRDHVQSGSALNREHPVTTPSGRIANQSVHAVFLHEPEEKPPSIKPKQQSVTQILPVIGRLNAVPPQIMSGRESIIAPPTIHVTIGRIEIKASLPLEKSRGRPSRSVTPNLSLEDHLKSRSGVSK